MAPTSPRGDRRGDPFGARRRRDSHHATGTDVDDSGAPGAPFRLGGGDRSTRERGRRRGSRRRHAGRHRCRRRRRLGRQQPGTDASSDRSRDPAGGETDRARRKALADHRHCRSRVGGELRGEGLAPDRSPIQRGHGQNRREPSGSRGWRRSSSASSRGCRGSGRDLDRARACRDPCAPQPPAARSSPASARARERSSDGFAPTR